jgi:hypothetical protein
VKALPNQHLAHEEARRFQFAVDLMKSGFKLREFCLHERNSESGTVSSTVGHNHRPLKKQGRAV